MSKKTKTQDQIGALRSLLPSKATKGEKTQLRVLEAAIACFAKNGIEATTYEDIAKKAGVSKPLVSHYFPQKDTLLGQCIRYIASNAQASVSQQNEHPRTTSKNAKEMLFRWIDSNFEWANAYPEHLRVWVYFLYQCTFDRSWSTINRQAVQTAVDRVTVIIEQGIEESRFKSQDPKSDARILQAATYSAILSLFTQTEPPWVEILKKDLRRLCKKLLQFE